MMLHIWRVLRTCEVLKSIHFSNYVMLPLCDTSVLAQMEINQSSSLRDPSDTFPSHNSIFADWENKIALKFFRGVLYNV